MAIKILPAAVTADPDRLTRFEREARMLAALNHPNIATIHGVEESDGVHALVLELVEGETLAERIARAIQKAARDSYWTRRWPSPVRSPTRSTPPTRRASSIGISSPPTSRSRPTAP